MVLVAKKNERIRFSTGISTVVTDWVQSKQKSKITSINKAIRTIIDKVENYSNECEISGKEIDLYELADIIKGDSITTPKKRKLFTDYIQMYYENHKQLKAHNTIKKYLTLKAFILKYSPDITLSDLDSSYASNLKKYCLDKGEMNNTISKRFQLIRVVLKWCEEMKYIKDVNYKYYTHPQTEKIEAVTLTEKDINKIASLDLSHRPNLDSIRDLFLIACHTGVDFTDLPQINKKTLRETEKGNHYFQIKRNKTANKEIYSFTPCDSLVYELLEKWKWDFQFISYDKSLQHLKTICELAGLNEQITFISKSGTKSIKITQPKYGWIGWKTGRRTFITHLMTIGKPTELVATAVGHTKTSTTAKYQHLKPAHMVDLLMKD